MYAMGRKRKFRLPVSDENAHCSEVHFIHAAL